MTLQHFFQDNPKVAIAFSGGVDSAFLLYEAVKYGSAVRPYYAKTPFQPAFELTDARHLCDELNIPLSVIELDTLSFPCITANGPDRCYHCKKAILSAIAASALADGFTLLLDGTNASDDVTDRPGTRALSELSVRSPLKECNLTKTDVRRLSKEAGLFTWNKASYSCLATRIPCGTVITATDLQRTELAENTLFAMGFTGFRVRCLGSQARLQLTATQLPLFLENRKNILNALRPHYSDVLLDLEVRDEQ